MQAQRQCAIGFGLLTRDVTSKVSEKIICKGLSELKLLVCFTSAGKWTQAIAASKSLLQGGHWQHAFCADLTGCESRSGVCLALQAALGIPGDSAGLDLLLAWLSRSELGLMGLIIRLPDSMAAPKDLAAVIDPLKSILQA